MSFYHLSVADRIADIMGSIKLMAPPHLERERELAHCKWFGYRFMSPLSATKHFADLYRRAVRGYTREHRDAELAERVQGLSLNVFSKPSGSLTELWRARQQADELGLPYDLLIDFGLYFAGRRKWGHTPRPLQLFGSKKSDVAWPMELGKYLEDRYPMALERLSGLPQYRTENYRCLPVQDEFRSHLLEHLREVNKPWAIMIGKQCVEDRHLPMLSTMKLVPKELRHGVVSEIRHDRNIGILNPAPIERLPSMALVPGCCGMPHARKAEAPECSACPFSAACEVLTRRVSGQMHDLYGSLSPLQDSRDNRKREMTRKRVARLRAKKADKASLSAGAS